MATNDSTGSFSPQERAAMKARAKELATEKRTEKKRAEGEQAVAEAIAAMDGSDHEFAQAIGAIIADVAPELWPKTWYGMPAWALDGKVICFFQAAGKFDSRYATFGFNDAATLDSGNMWATSFALVGMGLDEQARIRELVRAAVTAGG